MAVFTNFTDILPDPDNKINDAGATDVTGTAGPGFARVRFRSENYDVQESRTRSGRSVLSAPTSHSWVFDINYNPLTRDAFEPIMAFLESRQGGYLPFKVILPQYNRPRDDTFNTFLGSFSVVTVEGYNSGASTITIEGSGSTISGNPKPGDYFTITDAGDTNHTKAYKVTRVETETTYQSGNVVASGEKRLHLNIPLVRAVSSGATINFIDPQFQVKVRSDVLEYELGQDGLYEFSLPLKEIQL